MKISPLQEIQNLSKPTCLETVLNLDHTKGLAIEDEDFDLESYLEFCFEHIMIQHLKAMRPGVCRHHCKLNKTENNLTITSILIKNHEH